MKVLSIVVTYYPDISLLKENIGILLRYVDHILVWENMPKIDAVNYRVVDSPKIEFVGSGDNVGISRALNFAWKYAKEYGYEVPALHDYEKYNYTDDRNDGLRKWYIDYMNKAIKDSDGEFIGLPADIYSFKPIKTTDFIYSMKVDKLDEPKNVKQVIECIVYKTKRLFQAKNKDYNIVQTKGVSE